MRRTSCSDGDGGPALAAVVQDAGVDFDLAHALAVKRALEPCRWVEVNAALMLHEQAASDGRGPHYVMRWGLVTDQLADHVIRFLHEPTSRTYILTYPAGRELAEAYVRQRARRASAACSTEQVRVRDLLAARDGELGDIVRRVSSARPSTAGTTCRRRSSSPTSTGA